jgi:hypothetical protein
MRSFNPLPFRNIPFRMVTRYRAGTKYVMICKGFGMFDMLKMKPESKKAGRKELSIAIWLASSWVLATIDTSIPKLKPPNRKILERRGAEGYCPLRGHQIEEYSSEQTAPCQ